MALGQEYGILFLLLVLLWFVFRKEKHEFEVGEA